MVGPAIAAVTTTTSSHSAPIAHSSAAKTFVQVGADGLAGRPLAASSTPTP
jgi:hypothetical protein